MFSRARARGPGGREKKRFCGSVGGATTTSAFAYAPAVTDDEASESSTGEGRFHAPCGSYDGSFDILTHTGDVRKIEETAVFTFASVVENPGVIAVTATGRNPFGAFTMTGTCGSDGLRLLLVRKYHAAPAAKPKAAKPKKPKKAALKRRRTPSALAVEAGLAGGKPGGKRRAPARPRGPFGGKEPRTHERGAGTPAPPPTGTCARSPSTRGGHRGHGQNCKVGDAGLPLASVFDAARDALADANGGPTPPCGAGGAPGRVTAAPSVSRREAAALVKALVTPRALDPAWVEAFRPEEPRKTKAGGRDRSGKRTFGGFVGTEAATSLVSELEYEKCLRLFQEAFDKGNLSRLWPVAHDLLDDALARVSPGAGRRRDVGQLQTALLSRSDSTRFG